VCDELYGNKKPVLLSAIKKRWQGDPLEERPLISRLGLHAAELTLPHLGPRCENPEELVLKASLPRDMSALIKQMEKAAGKDFQAQVK
jgi:hypothetical protein